MEDAKYLVSQNTLYITLGGWSYSISTDRLDG